MGNQNITGVTPFLGANLQAFSASLGLNSSPTTLQVTLVEDNPFDPNANPKCTGFLVTAAAPGNITGFQFGAFQFIGMINGYSKHYGPDGWRYNVRLSDPRVLFQNIPVVLDSLEPWNQEIPNCLNPFQYYGGPQPADRTKDGMSFRKIRDYLTATGVMNLYGLKFLLQFSSGYFDSSGSLNPSGVPEWYRIPDTITNLSNMLDSVSRDLGFDYYSYIDWNSFNPTGTSLIKVQEINRVYAVSGQDIRLYISGAQSSGTLISYDVGRELRNDPTSCIVIGEKDTYWYGPNGSQIKPYWGRTQDGSALYDVNTNTSDGFVLLDHLRGSGSELVDSTAQVSFNQIILSQTANADIYPPQVTRVYTISTVSGYRPTQNMMRASLVSQKAWESIFFRDLPTLAQHWGITEQIFMSGSEFLTKPENVRWSTDLTRKSSGLYHRPQYIQNFLNSVYEATRSAVESYWGKQFILDLPTSVMFVSGLYNHSEVYPTIDYSIASAASSETTTSYPSGIPNYPVLAGSHNPIFKDEVGRSKAFLSVRNWDQYSSNLSVPIDPVYLDRNSALMEQGDQLVVPISVEQWDKYPIKAIVNVNNNIQGRIPPYLGNYAVMVAGFSEFLKLHGYDTATIDTYNIMQLAGVNKEFGLAPPRLSGIDSSPGSYGINIPLQQNFKYFGPFVATGGRPGGINIIQDSSISPWTFAGQAKMTLAGQQLANRGIAPIDTLDNASFVIAGIPEFNIGQFIGNNSNINGLSVQYGRDGVTTNYSVSTFALPIVRIAKNLSQRLSEYYYVMQRYFRDINVLTFGVDPFAPDTNRLIFGPQDVRDAQFQSDNLGFMVGIYKVTP